MDPQPTVTPLTSIETQLISRTKPFDAADLGYADSRWLHLDGANPKEEHEAAAVLVEKLLLEVTHNHPGGGTWYELTSRGLAYFHATWPHRKDTP